MKKCYLVLIGLLLARGVWGNTQPVTAVERNGDTRFFNGEIMQFVSYGLAMGMNPDGSTVVGETMGPDGFIWHNETGLHYIEGAPGGVSDDGTTVIGTVLDANSAREAAIWENGVLVRTLGALPDQQPPGHLSAGLAISGDGKTAVGLGYTTQYDGRGFYWTEETGMVELPHSNDENANSRASVMSGDAWVIGGYDIGATLWYADGSVISLTPGGGVVTGISRNGKYAVGRGYDEVSGESKPFIWHKGQGIRFLDDPPNAPLPNHGFYATAVSDNGRIVVGSGGIHGGNGLIAWVWTESHGTVSLKSLLEKKGIPWTMDLVQRLPDISADGNLILAYGEYPFDSKSYLINLKALLHP